MHFTSLLALVPLVSAGCFSGGDTWNGFEATAREHVKSICNSNGISGFFNSGQIKRNCVKLNDAHKADFTVQWHGGSGLTLDDADCQVRLTNEINGCQNGGSSTISDWSFTSDPNAGGC